MITKVGTVCVFVADQDRAKAFYTDVLGMELRTDQPLYPGAPNRWLSVAPEGAQTEIILYLPDQNWEHYKQVVGQSQAVTLTVDDLIAWHKGMVEKGVKFAVEPTVEPWGSHAIFVDSEGNRLLAVEQPKR
jgi:lactoylglutathione lyase